MQTNIWRRFSLILRLVGLCGFLGSLSGCTLMAINKVQRSKEVYTKPINDQLITFSKYGQEAAQKAGKEPIITFSGGQRTYVLNSGGEQTLYLVQAFTRTPELDPKKLRLSLHNEENISTSDTQVLRGKLNFNYKVANAESGNSERDVLDRLGFAAKNQDQAYNQNLEFYQSVPVTGFIKRTTDTSGTTTEQGEHLVSHIPLVVNEAREIKRYINPLPILALPFTVVGDILLSPVYLYLIESYRK